MCIPDVRRDQKRALHLLVLESWTTMVSGWATMCVLGIEPKSFSRTIGAPNG